MAWEYKVIKINDYQREESFLLSTGVSCERSSCANNGNNTWIPPTEFKVLCMECVMTAFTSWK